MLIIALRKGGSPCSTDCPFYTETGKVTGVRGVPLKTHCRMTMNPWMADCDVYNVHSIDKMEVSEEEWKAMQKAVHKKAIRQRKLYPEEHEEIHHIGENTRRFRTGAIQPCGDKGKWNATKSKNPLQLPHKGERKKTAN